MGENEVTPPQSTGTTRDFGNMLNQKIKRKKPTKMPSSPWTKMKGSCP